MPVNFDDPSLNSFREIPPESIGGGIFDFFPFNFRPEVDNDVISGLTVDNVGTDVPVKFSDSRSNGFRDIRGADFVSNERTLVQAYPNGAKRIISPDKINELCPNYRCRPLVSYC